MALRRYRYSMRHNWLTCPDIGRLYPIFCQEVTPFDTWFGHSGGFIRAAAMDVPTFTQLGIHVHFFFVPHRIVDSTFEDIITGVSASSFPTISVTTAAGSEDLPRQLGLGIPGASGNYSVRAHAVRAFNMVWNEFFRDQKEQSARTEDQLGECPQVNYATSDLYAGARSTVQQGSEVTVDSSGATIGVTEIRDAFHRQKFQERRSQFGERYFDYLAAIGGRVPNSRLDRPEHVARGQGILGISEVVATATSASEDTGQYRGHGITSFRIRFRKRVFVEHGTLLGVMAVRPRAQIRQQVPMQWLVSGKDDLYQPELARDSQVVVPDRAVSSADQTGGNYGYIVRDAWLRKPVDILAGLMQDDAQDAWHTGKNHSSGAPSIDSYLAVSAFKKLFQDQTAGAPNLYAYFDHHIRKRSIIPKERSLA